MTNPVVVVSPHLDDAVLSCGQFMYDRQDCVVVTVFAGVPTDRTQRTTYDRDSGFRSAADAIEARRNEDGRALHAVRATGVHLPFIDGQYLEPAPIDAVAQALHATIVDVGPEFVLAPVGVLHPDHERVSNATLAACSTTHSDLWLYEELPGRVLDPLAVCDRLRYVRERLHLDVEFGHPGAAGPIDRKERALRYYRSQLWALDRHCLLVPERYWRVTA